MAKYEFMPSANVQARDVVSNVEPGRYLLRILELKVANTRNGDSLVISTKSVASMDNKFVGVKLPDFWVSLDPGNDMRSRDYIELMESCGVDWKKGEFDTDWFTGLQVVAEIGVYTKKDSGQPPRNVINQWIHPKFWRGPVASDPNVAKPINPHKSASPAPATKQIEDEPLDLNANPDLEIK